MRATETEIRGLSTERRGSSTTVSCTLRIIGFSPAKSTARASPAVSWRHLRSQRLRTTA